MDKNRSGSCFFRRTSGSAAALPAPLKRNCPLSRNCRPNRDRTPRCVRCHNARRYAGPSIPDLRCLRQRITREMCKETMNLDNVYFVSKGTGPRTVQIEAQNSVGVKAQVEARYPGAYNITLNQLPTSAKKKRE